MTEPTPIRITEESHAEPEAFAIHRIAHFPVIESMRFLSSILVTDDGLEIRRRGEGVDLYHIDGRLTPKATRALLALMEQWNATGGHMVTFTEYRP